ncbi:MAG: dihydrofolate reductase family protein [Candidatus Planktophila sp.]
MIGAMGISFSLVVGVDGSTSWANNSSGISTPADRADFLARRAGFDCIIIGGNTARCEPYSKTPVPLVIISRSDVNPVPENPIAHVWRKSIGEAITQAKARFGENIHIEGGITLIKELLAADAIDDLYLTITPAIGGLNIFDWKSALKSFNHHTVSEINGTTFYHAWRSEGGN